MFYVKVAELNVIMFYVMCQFLVRRFLFS